VTAAACVPQKVHRASQGQQRRCKGPPEQVPKVRGVYRWFYGGFLVGGDWNHGIL